MYRITHLKSLFITRNLMAFRSYGKWSVYAVEDHWGLKLIPRINGGSCFAYMQPFRELHDFPLFIFVPSVVDLAPLHQRTEIQPSHVISSLCQLNKYQWGIPKNHVFTETMHNILCACSILIMISSPPSSGCCNSFLLCQKEL